MEKENQDKISLPFNADISSMLIHMAYVRKDVDEIKTVLKDIKNGYVSRIDFEEHLKVDEDHEHRIRDIEENTSDIKTIKKLVYGCAGLILASVVTSIIYLVITN